MAENMETHPSFGSITIGKISGEHTLFGSRTTHSHAISLKIHPASLITETYRDRVFPSPDTFIEVRMTEAQWAHMLSSFSDPEGTPVTIKRIKGVGLIEDPPPHKKEVDVLKNKAEDVVKGFAREVKDLETQVAAMADKKTVSKKDLADLARNLRTFAGRLSSNLDFVHDSAVERMEDLVQRTKLEIEAIVGHRFQEAGRQALGAVFGESLNTLPSEIDGTSSERP
jgi:hypothetical protein